MLKVLLVGNEYKQIITAKGNLQKYGTGSSSEYK
ncbi:hypothetical protein JL09_g6286 [Pichia kudriavzevii]|uniref:Uncharacterized protein n=1 Tax=Pichia kudriavzevii TaxID=4909 RepID=A0A099NRN4_PICKU|nr:hypothetical protein JL09_g6286 [Pichia kudriavzevii]